LAAYFKKEASVANYTFEYKGKNGKCSSGVRADTDEEAYIKIDVFLEENAGKLVPDTIRMTDYRAVPDPPKKLDAAPSYEI